ncbi:hypothetical protein [Paraburkholderia solisilvae]|uniref:Uncharacterized protein n=1 Tax=Paraburkholderia solisilvae TaxID=624376 RepID=A0A6J5DH42_9BURK|nr:hypothetical protein [Paraburkholderia solisilvae]CAB3752355.1 hypothetical protein LMG29739_01534 [Paraburkholderia solisilvae]
MKALLAVIASASLLLIPVASFAQNTNGMGSGATTNGYGSGATSTEQQSWRQPGAASQSAPPDDTIDYGMPANSTYQYGRSTSSRSAEPIFGHH